MSKAEKQLERLLSIPSDLTWEELLAVMTKHNFVLKTAHKPHPKNIMQKYAIEAAILALKNAGEI